jgi:hypothetical protein
MFCNSREVPDTVTFRAPKQLLRGIVSGDFGLGPLQGVLAGGPFVFESRGGSFVLLKGRIQYSRRGETILH